MPVNERGFVARRSAGPGGVLPDGELRDAYEALSASDDREGVIPLFASPIYRKRLRANAEEMTSLNAEIAEMFRRIQARDEEGVSWSAEHYVGGYTSYSSLPALQGWVPCIKQLEKWLEPHVLDFRKNAMLDGVPPLFMTDCWANVMGEGTKHSIHQHKKSTVSGTYYVQTPEGCSGLAFEDPRLDRTVARQRRQLIECPAVAGYVTLFESWQRHTVPPNEGAKGSRISVSFNYHWRYEEPTQLD